MGFFIERLLEQYEPWKALPVLDRTGDSWRGAALIVPPPPGSDLAGPLDIDETGGEITISLDYSHIHMAWPLKMDRMAGSLWANAMIMIDAILKEKVVASSGWIDGQLRAGSLHEVDRPAQLLVSKLERLRVRSWRGTYDHDEELAR